VENFLGTHHKLSDRNLGSLVFAKDSQKLHEFLAEILVKLSRRFGPDQGHKLCSLTNPFLGVVFALPLQIIIDGREQSKLENMTVRKMPYIMQEGS
jgi:hypothetical protein